MYVQNNSAWMTVEADGYVVLAKMFWPGLGSVINSD